MKRKNIIAIGLLCAMGAFAQDFPAYLKMEGTVITGCDKNALPANLVIPDGVTEIGRHAFSESGLKTVTIPEGVTKIGNDAFYDCKYLKSVTLPKSLAEIGSEAFLGCESLKSVSIPRSVMKIGSYAFSRCYNIAVQYEGTKAQWDAISKYYIGTSPVLCSDGECLGFNLDDASFER